MRLDLSLSLSSMAMRRPRAPSYDADALALFAAMSVQPDATRKKLISDTIVNLKDTGAWSLKDILYATAAHHTQASRLNWKDPSQYMLTPQNAPVFTVDRGWQGDGATSYLGSGFLPATNGANWTVNDASIWMWTTTNSSDANPDIGAGTAFVTALVARNGSGSIEGISNRVGTTLSGAVASSVGLSGVQRRASGDERIWKNGVQIASGTAAASGRPSGEFRICGRSPGSFGTRQISFASAGASLIDKEAAFHSAINTYMQAVGAA
ncbi:hypothetical protein CHELA1G11_12959 [Hyphomicrobiales bacterium]|nr:hypothetical protein CHELA1G2_11350 [Hyphomicrobiales bacterium]CAH1668322.1 hypothetical protein CHELA1G11_12959 [Hyphomicrobiales bacterium]